MSQTIDALFQDIRESIDSGKAFESQPVQDDDLRAISEAGRRSLRALADAIKRGFRALVKGIVEALVRLAESNHEHDQIDACFDEVRDKIFAELEAARRRAHETLGGLHHESDRFGLLIILGALATWVLVLIWAILRSRQRFEARQSTLWLREREREWLAMIDGWFKEIP